MESIGIVIALLGLAWTAFFTFVHFRAVGKARASESWPTTIGKVLSSRVVEEKSEDRHGTRTTWYNPVVHYSYAAGGRTLEASRIRFANMRKSSRARAEEILGRYAEGASPAVRYNPDKPEEAVLETHKPGPLYLVMAAFGLLFVAFGLVWSSVA